MLRKARVLRAFALLGFRVAREGSNALFVRADMRWRNITYVHMYEEGNDLDFDMGPCTDSTQHSSRDPAAAPKPPWRLEWPPQAAAAPEAAQQSHGSHCSIAAAAHGAFRVLSTAG